MDYIFSILKMPICTIKDILGIIALSGIALYVFIFSTWFKTVRLAFSLPGPPALPFVGNTLIAIDPNNVSLGNTLNTTYGRLVRIWIYFMPIFVVSEPEDLQKILGTNQNTDKSYFYAFMHNFLGEGLITNNGDKWKMHRKMIQSIFHKNLLESFVDNFSECSKSFLHELEDVVKKEQDINITSYVNRTVIKILNEVVLGIKEKTLQDENQLTSPFREGKVQAQKRLVRPWLLLDSIYQFTKLAKEELNQKKNLFLFTKKIVDQKREANEIGKNINELNQTSIIDKMIQIGDENEQFTDKDIVDEICTFMLAGQDSVSSAIAFCLYFLAKHQDIQEKAYAEVDDIFNESENGVNIHQLKKMKYLEQCIKETLRLCPSVPLLSRKLSEDIYIGNHKLPNGTDVFISPLLTHRLPHIYPDPHVYNPDRFSAKEIEARHPFAYLPFSSGPRNCIGNKFAIIEMKTVISAILKEYHLSLKPGYKLDLSFRITLRARGGIWLKLKPRK